MFRFTPVPGKVFFVVAPEREPYQFWEFVHRRSLQKLFCLDVPDKSLIRLDRGVVERLLIFSLAKAISSAWWLVGPAFAATFGSGRLSSSLLKFGALAAFAGAESPLRADLLTGRCPA